MTGVGDAKASPKGAVLVNPTQRHVSTWNEFVKAYQSDYRMSVIYPWCWEYRQNYEVSLMQYLSDRNDDYPNDNRKLFEVKNQLGL